MNTLAEIASQEGMLTVRLLLQLTAQKLQLRLMEHEIEELKARLTAWEGSALP